MPLIPNPAGDLFRRVDKTIATVDVVIGQVDGTLREVSGTLKKVDGTLSTVSGTLAEATEVLGQVRALLVEPQDEMQLLRQVPEIAAQVREIHELIIRASPAGKPK